MLLEAGMYDVCFSWKDIGESQPTGGLGRPLGGNSTTGAAKQLELGIQEKQHASHAPGELRRVTERVFLPEKPKTSKWTT